MSLEDKILFGIVISGSIFLALLITFNIEYVVDPPRDTVLTFQGEAIKFFPGGDLFMNVMQSPPRLFFYGMDYSSNIQLQVSDLIDPNSGSIIDSNRLTLLDIFMPNIITTEVPRIVNFSINNPSDLDYGTYYGGLFTTISSNLITFPLKLEVTPPTYTAIILVINGIVISVVAWNLVSIYNSEGSINLTSIKSYISKYLIESNTTVTAAGAVTSYHLKTVKLGKNVVLDIAAIFFGIVLGFITFGANETLLNIDSLEPWDSAILIATGLGIGAAKEFIKSIK